MPPRQVRVVGGEEEADRLRDSYRRIEELTGIRIGEAFFSGIASGKRRLDSEPPAIALAAFRELQSGHSELEFVRAILRSIFWDGGDPNDIQSLIHLLHYTDILRVEGLISSPGPGAVNRAELIQEWVERTDLDALRSLGYHDLMDEASILSVIRQGAKEPGAPGPGRETAGSQLLIERARSEDPLGLGRPLWVLVWGSMTDVAQALHDAPDIAGRIRIYSIGSNNTRRDPASRNFVYHGMKMRQWPGLWWIENGIMPVRSHDTFRGYYLGGEQSGEWHHRTFVEYNIRGRGATHGGKFKMKTGDAMPLAPNDPSGILKEGDSPSFTYLLAPVIGGVGNVDDPTQESWGGQFRRPEPVWCPNYYCDLDAPAAVCQETVSK